MIHKPKYENYNKTTINTSSESHMYWKKLFHKNPLHCKSGEDFDADNEIDQSSIGKKTTNSYKQNPVLKGDHIESELDDILQSSYYKSPAVYDNTDWFFNEVIKLENKIAFFFKNTKKEIIMTEKDEED